MRCLRTGSCTRRMPACRACDAPHACLAACGAHSCAAPTEAGGGLTRMHTLQTVRRRAGRGLQEHSQRRTRPAERAHLSGWSQPVPRASSRGDQPGGHAPRRGGGGRTPASAAATHLALQGVHLPRVEAVEVQHGVHRPLADELGNGLQLLRQQPRHSGASCGGRAARKRP